MLDATTSARANVDAKLTPFVPAEAGTQFFGQLLGSRFRGNERRMVRRPGTTH
jgi:hypothetical protein